MYRVVVRFIDSQDSGHPYNVGDVFPRSGRKVSKERLEELSSSRNRRGIVLIVNDEPKKVLPEVEEGIEEPKTGVRPVESPEVKKRPRKGRKKE